MNERRKNIRINKTLIVRFKLPKNYLGMSSRSEDMSEGGMRMVVLQRLEPGMRLELNFNIQENAKPITVTAKVIWVDYKKESYFPFTVGLQFTNLADFDRERLREHIGRIIQDQNSSAS